MLRLLNFKTFYLCLLVLVFALSAPSMVFANTDIVISVKDPTRDQGGEWYEGTTVNTVLSQPVVNIGDNRVLGTLRITGKQGVSVPLQPGNKVMITLPVGICYMTVPTSDNYFHYAKWPDTLDGKTNQIIDTNNKPGIKFISGTPRTLTVEVTNIDVAHDTVILDFVFDEEYYSAVRISRLIEVANDYMKMPKEKVTRLEYFDLLADITMPFSSSPVKFRDGHRELEERFVDINHLDESIKYKLKMLADAGIIVGSQDRMLKPDNYITRAEAAALAGRVVPGIHWRHIFSDTLPVWAAYEINNAVDNGIIVGYPDGTFQPNRILVKSEAISILQGTLEAYSLERYLKYK